MAKPSDKRAASAANKAGEKLSLAKFPPEAARKNFKVLARISN